MTFKEWKQDQYPLLEDESGLAEAAWRAAIENAAKLVEKNHWLQAGELIWSLNNENT